MQISGQKIERGGRAFLIAEIGQNHDGSLGLAHSYIDAAAAAGADAVKFQTHIAAAESSREDTWRVKFSKQDATRYDYWKRMEFSPEQWAGLKAHCDAAGIIFLSSAFSPEAVTLLASLDMPAWKLGSGEFKNTALMTIMKATGKPLLYSTGMSNWAEIDRVVRDLSQEAYPFGVFQCTSMYPTPPDCVGLNVVSEMLARYPDVPVGLSDHSGTIYPALAALARGASLIELHLTFDRAMFGPDVLASVTTVEFRQIADARNAFCKMDANPVDKDVLSVRLSGMRDLFTKSISPAHDLKAGDVLTEENLRAKKPGTGIAYEDRHLLLGRRVSRPVALDELLRWEDLEPDDA